VTIANYNATFLVLLRVRPHVKDAILHRNKGTLRYINNLILVVSLEVGRTAIR